MGAKGARIVVVASVGMVGVGARGTGVVLRTDVGSGSGRARVWWGASGRTGTVEGTTRRGTKGVRLTWWASALWARGVARAKVVEPLAVRVVQIHGSSGVQIGAEVSSGTSGVCAMACVSIDAKFFQRGREGSAVTLAKHVHLHFGREAVDNREAGCGV